MYAVELQNISKTFDGGVQANKNITLNVIKGEVHALLGENGAGKSTICNILYGLLSKDSGTIKINGQEVDIKSPQDAIEYGVGMIHQDFKLIEPLTVTENVVMGLEPPEKNHRRSGLLLLFIISLFSFFMFFISLPIELADGSLDYTPSLITSILFVATIILFYFGPSYLGKLFSKLGKIGKGFLRIGRFINGLVKNVLPVGLKDAEKRIIQIAEENGLQIDPTAIIANISVGLQQRVEIIKTLYRDADILILDEPTSVLTPQEVDELFITLEKFKQSGKTIILITHKLREPMVLADRISVLRDGELVGTVNTIDTSPEALAEMMVGRPVVFTVEKPPMDPGDDILSVSNLVVEDNRKMIAVSGISFSVRSGEIFGIAGVDGNGQTELVEAITGLRKIKNGGVLIGSQHMAGKSPRQIRAAGLSHIPQDRHKRGVILNFSIQENLVLGSHHLPPFASSKGILDLEQFESNASKLVDEYSIRIGDVRDAVSNLSGGNQQKVVVARELSTQPKIVIAAQPTRGLDVGATEYIHEMLIALRNKGVAILLVSSELDEIRSLSDRIGVIFQGEIVAIKKPEETNAKELGLLMAGHYKPSEIMEGTQ